MMPIVFIINKILLLIIITRIIILNSDESNMNDDYVDDNNIIMIIIIFTFKDCSLNCIKCIDLKCTSSSWLANADKRSCIGTDRRRIWDFPRE